MVKLPIICGIIIICPTLEYNIKHNILIIIYTYNYYKLQCCLFPLAYKKRIFNKNIVLVLYILVNIIIYKY